MTSRPPRVLLLSDRLDMAGGVERFVCHLANHLASVGMDVAVGSVDTPRARVHYPLDARVRVLTGKVAPLHAAGPRAWRLFQQQRRIGRALSALTRAEGPDVVLLNGLTTACSTLLFDRSFIDRTIVCDHNHFDARSRSWRLMRSWLYPKAAALVSLTQADAPRFRALNPRTRVIYNASTLRAQGPVPARSPLVLALGRHVRQKGFDLLLQAWKQVVVTLPQARLRVLGDGPLLAETQAQARALGVDASVEWLPPTTDVAAHYREAAVFVLPSRYEGMPLALLEAQAMGVPSVAFDCPTGPAEILTPTTGCLVPAGDVAGLAAAIVELLRSDGLRQRMGQAAIVRSNELFDPARHAQAWTALVREVATT
jgi:glycosyltransferase involved in cell wall biosynthesis